MSDQLHSHYKEARFVLQRVHERVAKKVVADYLRGAPEGIRGSFNEWFEIEGVISLYVRCTMRALPLDMFAALGADDPLPRKESAEFKLMTFPVLELASISVSKDRWGNMTARYVIDQMAQMSDFFQRYFIVENVGRELNGFFHRRPEQYKLDTRTLPGCWWRVYKNAPRVFDVATAAAEAQDLDDLTQGEEE